MRKVKKKIFLVLLIGIMLTPTVCSAKVRSGFHSSSHSRTHISSSSSRSKISLSKSKVSSPKLKSGTKTLRPSKGTTIPRTVKNKSNTTTKKNVNNKVSNKSSLSKVFTVKKKSNNVKPIKIDSSNYSKKPLNYSNDLSFWKYYGIYNMVKDNDDVSERDIANALAKKGYSQSEINSILYDANKENTDKNKKSNPFVVFLFIVAILICLGIIIFMLV